MSSFFIVEVFAFVAELLGLLSRIPWKMLVPVLLADVESLARYGRGLVGRAVAPGRALTGLLVTLVDRAVFAVYVAAKGD